MERIDVLFEKVAPASMEHKCCVCGEIIHEGESYYRIRGKVDGVQTDLGCHLKCRKDMKNPD